ncbi:MAG TPA: GNAT family protein [Rhizobacter sp.]|nr:GNAT family protein [Rhizobacter sp.]
MNAAVPAVLPSRLALRHGRSAVVREIQPDDREAFNAAFLRLSADARYTRFLNPIRQLSDATLDLATNPAPEREFALVALDGDGPDAAIVAGARYVASMDQSDTCEFAVTIADDWQGLGLAGHLLPILMATARERGLRCMEGFVLPANTAMRRLAVRLGFTDAAVPGDWSLRRVSIELDKWAP